MTDGDWVDFQASPEFTATLERRKKKTLKLRSDSMTCTDRSMEIIKRVGMTTLHDNLDVVCSMTKFSLEEFHLSQIGIGVKKELLNGKESFEVAPMTPDTMFEILRRNYLYHVSRLAFEPQVRIQIQSVQGLSQFDRVMLAGIIREPLIIFAECLGNGSFAHDTSA